MNKNIWIDIREIQDLDINILPETLYQWVRKSRSQLGIYFPKDVLDQLQNIVEQYLRVMWLDSTLYPARVDLGFSSQGYPIMYEITTGFVDQVGSCLSLQQALWDSTWLDSLSQTPFFSSVLTSTPYFPEYKIMREMFEKSGKKLLEEETEKTFVYGYPTENMLWDFRFIPWWRWLESEEKKSQIKILQRIVQGGNFVIPRYFSSEDTSYRDLPNERDTQLVFKQNIPKLKGQRNTIIFGKWALAQSRYESWEMLAQEYIESYRDSENRRFEAKALFMPSQNGTNFTGMYVLIDTTVPTANFWNTKIPNDGYPQGPWIIIP